jgi:hypothetical protein
MVPAGGSLARRAFGMDNAGVLTYVQGAKSRMQDRPAGRRRVAAADVACSYKSLI